MPAASARSFATPHGRTPSITSSIAAADPHETGERLSRALLTYLIAIVLIITLLPFRFALPDRFRIELASPPFDLVMNVVMFMPLGFLYRLWRGGRSVSLWRVLMLGLVASACIECSQLFELERYSSPWDVMTNGIGAWLGALVHAKMERRLSVDARLVGRLSLELPLMGLVYLLVPLLWIDGLAAGHDASRGWLTVLIALFGATLLASMQRYHFGPMRGVPRRTVAIAAGLWFLVGGFPALPRRPAITLVLALATGIFVYLQGRHVDARAIERRFERQALRLGAPIYAALLLLLPALATGAFTSGWHASMGVGGSSSEWSSEEILRLLERLAAFTLLGYMVAEWRGRVDRTARGAIARVLPAALLAAGVCESIDGFRAGYAASLTIVSLAVVASLYGAWLYRLQRDHVLAMLGKT